MDSTSLDLAYSEFLAAAEAVAASGADAKAPPGEWDAGQQLAHVIALDASLLVTVCSVASGSHATFDSRLSHDTFNLTRIQQRSGNQARMRDRVRAQGRALCEVVDQLSDDELDQLVPTLLLAGDTAVVDQPISLRDLLAGIAGNHLPGHTEQLLALVPASA